MRTEEQLDIPGIGQQTMTLKIWKSDNQLNVKDFGTIETILGPLYRFNVWADPLSLDDAEEQLGNNGVGAGDTEKEAILDFCLKTDLEPPFWWAV